MSSRVTHHWWPYRSGVWVQAIVQSLFVGDAKKACLQYSALQLKALLPDQDHHGSSPDPKLLAFYTRWINCNLQCRTLTLIWGEWSKMATVLLRECVEIHCTVISVGCWRETQKSLDKLWCVLVIIEANQECHQRASSKPVLCLCSLMLITVANTLGPLIYWLKDKASLYVYLSSGKGLYRY